MQNNHKVNEMEEEIEQLTHDFNENKVIVERTKEYLFILEYENDKKNKEIIRLNEEIKNINDAHNNEIKKANKTIKKQKKIIQDLKQEIESIKSDSSSKVKKPLGWLKK